MASFWKPEACGQTVLPDMSVLIGQKLVENAIISKIQMRHFGQFSNNVNSRKVHWEIHEIYIGKNEFDSSLANHLNPWFMREVALEYVKMLDNSTISNHEIIIDPLESSEACFQTFTYWKKCPNFLINQLSGIEDNPEQNSKNERLGLQSRTLRIEVSLLKL